MDILWGDSALKPEGADELNAENLKNCKGDLLVMDPKKPYKGPKLRPKGQWVEVWPEYSFRTISPSIWSSPLILKTVGVIAGFDLELSGYIANLAFSKKLQKVDTQGNIAILNGPNLNLLGERQPEIYGKATLEQIFNECKIIAPNCRFVFRQSNSEGEIVTLIQKLRHETDAIIINAGAYTHTSIAIMDALNAYDDQIIELHLSNPHQRETFRKVSYITPVADSYIAGFGALGYKLALIAALMRL